MISQMKAKTTASPKAEQKKDSSTPSFEERRQLVERGMQELLEEHSCRLQPKIIWDENGARPVLFLSDIKKDEKAKEDKKPPAAD